jgi:hypothetical protein
MTDLLEGYTPGGYYCELFGGDGAPLEHTQAIRNWLARTRPRALKKRAQDCERELFSLGITFTVYSDRDAIDRVLPFDVIPRPISASEWAHLEAGLKQRVAAINLFLRDAYGPGKIFKDGIVPERLVTGNDNYRAEMTEVEIPFNSFVNICGVDLVRGGDGVFRVLEDNARTPSGVSYVIENRHLMQRSFPDLMRGVGLRSVSEYGMRLRDALAEMAPAGIMDPQIVLLSVGRQFALQVGIVFERQFFGLGFEEKVERVLHRHVGDQVDRDFKPLDRIGEHDAGLIIAVRVLLPIDEVALGLNLERIAQYGGARVRRRAQPDDLRSHLRLAVVDVAGAVIKRGVDAHYRAPRAIVVLFDVCALVAHWRMPILGNRTAAVRGNSATPAGRAGRRRVKSTDFQEIGWGTRTRT